LISLLASKGITPNRSVVVYGYGQDESAAMAKILRGLGYTNVLTHDAGLAEWAADDSLPMARLANEVFDFVSDPANDALYRGGAKFADLGQRFSIVPRQTLHETIWKRFVCRIRKMSVMVAEATETVSMAPLEMSEPHPFLESP
jgi:hypothetical protein